MHVASRALPPADMDQAPDASALATEASVAGVERRLVRRAEAVWDSLCLGAALPPASAAGTLLAAPFAPHALMFAFPPYPAEPDAVQPRILRCGRALAELGITGPGPVAPDSSPSAPPAAQLAMLAARAVALREPIVLERDSLTLAGHGVDSTPDGHLGALLLRAVALPFAADANSGPLVVAIASWRRLLSVEEAENLARELRAAVAALRARS